MTARSGFARLGGLASMVGGVLWIVAIGVAQLRPAQLVGLVAVPSLCLVLGLVALQRRRVTRPGPITNVGFALALLGSVLLAYGSTGKLVFSGQVGGIGYGPFLFTGVAFGALVLGLGTAVIALSMIVADVLPRLSPIPLLVGALGVSVAGALALARQLQRGPANDIFPFDAPSLAVLWVMFGLSWLWLGFLLHSEQARPRSTPDDPAWAAAPERIDPPRSDAAHDNRPARA